MKPILNSYTTEINLGPGTPANGQFINFQDFPQLRNKIIYGVMAADNTTLFISPQLQPVVSTLNGLALTLIDKNNFEVIYQYPCFDLNPVNAGGFYRNFIPFECNLVKSGILITDASGYAANQSVIFNFIYGDKTAIRPGAVKVH